MNCCELKFYNKEFLLTKEYWQKLKERESKLAEKCSKKQAIHHVLITTFGIKKNEYSSFFKKVIALDDFFWTRRKI